MENKQESDIPFTPIKLSDGTLRDAKGKIIKGAGQNTNKYGTAGRPTNVTPDVLMKLNHAFAIGATDEEACAFAGIQPAVLYAHQRRNPEYIKEKERQKELLVLKARQTVVKSLHKDSVATWYLGKKGRDFQSNNQTLLQVNVFTNKENKEEVEVIEQKQEEYQ